MFLVEPGGDFVARVVELHVNEEQRQQRAQRGQKLSRTEFLWTKCTANYADRVQAEDNP